MSDHIAIDTRVGTRPVWRTFLLLFLTSSLYRTWWAWRANTDVEAFGRARAGRVDESRAVRANAGASAFATFLLLPGASLVLFGLLFASATVPDEYGIEQPSTSDVAAMLVVGLAFLVPGVIAQWRTARRIRRARELAGLEPTTAGTGRALPLLLALEVVAVPASMFAMQHSLNDLWSRFPPLLDEDVHGELAPPARREHAIAQRPMLHEQRLRRVAHELERPGLIPWVTIGFGALCVVMFCWQLYEHGPFPDTEDIERVGGLREGLDGGWWRFWVANVLHAGFDHLTGNMLAWAFIGTMLERVVGHVRMLALIVVGAAGCSIGATIAHPDIVGIGASGIVFAAFGMAAMVDPLARRAVGKLGWSLVLLGIGLSTFAEGVSSGGHVGGVVAGFAMGGIVTFVWRVRRPVTTAADRLALRRAPLDRNAPLAPDRQLTIAERLEHLERRHAAGAIDDAEHDRLRDALVALG